VSVLAEDRSGEQARHEINVRVHIGPAPATVRKIHSTLHEAFTQAVSDGLIPRNAADVKAPRPAPQEMRPLLEAEACFLRPGSGDRFGAL
jgi:integrase